MNKILINIKELCGILENQEKPLGGDEVNSLKTIKNAYLEISRWENSIIWKNG